MRDGGPRALQVGEQWGLALRVREVAGGAEGGFSPLPGTQGSSQAAVHEMWKKAFHPLIQGGRKLVCVKESWYHQRQITHVLLPFDGEPPRALMPVCASSSSPCAHLVLHKSRW